MRKRRRPPIAWVNTDPAATQNFKYVSWAGVAAALNLP